MIGRLVSGGQTGVDRAALDAALELGVPCGGWCPKGRKAEDGTVPDRYPLTETPSGSYSQRTRWNIRDSDATLVLSWGKPTGGVLLTLNECRKVGKPHLVIDQNPQSRGLVCLSKERYLIERVVLRAPAGPVDGAHEQRMHNGNARRSEPRAQPAFAKFVHEKSDGAAIHAIDRLAGMHEPVQGLQHEPVAAKRDDHVGSLSRRISIFEGEPVQ